MQTYNLNPVNARNWLVKGHKIEFRPPVCFFGQNFSAIFKFPSRAAFCPDNPHPVIPFLATPFHIFGVNAHNMSDFSDPSWFSERITIWLTKQPFFSSVPRLRPNREPVAVKWAMDNGVCFSNLHKPYHDDAVGVSNLHIKKWAFPAWMADNMTKAQAQRAEKRSLFSRCDIAFGVGGKCWQYFCTKKKSGGLP